MTALEKYKISFVKVARFNGRIKVHSVNDYFSSFLGEHRTIYDATELVNGINDAINNSLQDPERGFPTQGMLIAVIDATQTKIYDDLKAYATNHGIPPTFTLPTADFKEIVEAWVQYLAGEQ